MSSQSKIWKKLRAAGLSVSVCSYALPVWALYKVPVNIAKPNVGASMGSAGAANVVVLTRIQTQVPGNLGVSLNGSIVGVNSPDREAAATVSQTPAHSVVMPAVVEKHPVMGLINDLQTAGVPIQSMPKTSQEFSPLA